MLGISKLQLGQNFIVLDYSLMNLILSLLFYIFFIISWSLMISNLEHERQIDFIMGSNWSVVYATLKNGSNNWIYDVWPGQLI